MLRINEWPVETLSAFSAVDFAAETDAVECSTAHMAVRASSLADRIYAAVPHARDRESRRWLLSLKRTLYRDPCGWIEPSQWVIRWLTRDMPALMDELNLERAARSSLDERRRRLAGTYETVLAVQRRALANVADEARFMRALTLAVPGLAERWRNRTRRARGGESHRRHLEASVARYVLRAIGRPTPHGAWASVATVEPAGSGPEYHIASRTSRAAANLDLRPFRDAVQQLAASERYTRNYPVRLDPAVHRSYDSWQFLDRNGDWRSLTASVAVDAIVYAFADGVAKPAEPLLDAMAGDSTGSARLRSILRETTDVLLGVGVLRSALELPPAPRSAWDALESVAGQLLEDDAEPWRQAIATCRRIATAIETDFDQLDPEKLLGFVREAQRTVADLLATLGVAGSAYEPVIRVDVRAPFEAHWSRGARTRLRQAVWAVLDVHEQAGAAEAYRRSLLADFVGTEMSLAHAVRAQRDLRGSALAAGMDAWRTWWGAIADGVAGDAVRLCSRAARAAPELQGSMAFEFTDERPAVFRWARPEAAIAWSRFADLLDAEVSPADEIGEGCGSVPLVEVVGVDAANPNAAVRRLDGRSQLGRHGHTSAPFAAVTLIVDDRARSWLVWSGDARRRRPIYSSAAGIGLWDPASRFLSRLCLSHGWEFMALGVPMMTGTGKPAYAMPRVEVSDRVVLAPRRWRIDAAELLTARAASRCARYRAWRQIIRARAIGDLVWLAAGERSDAPSFLFRTDSPLLVDCLFERILSPASDLIVSEAPDPAAWRVRDENDRHYAAEIVVTWNTSERAS